jgi:transposase
MTKRANRRRLLTYRQRANAKQVEELCAALACKPNTWRWCLHCNRCYRAKEATYQQGIMMCAYTDCFGDALFDGWKWGHIRKVNGYPAQPVPSKAYPQYGEEE